MRGFSHSDRIGGRINLLDPARIQDVICKGKDIFGMLPEAYSVRCVQTVLQTVLTSPSVVSGFVVSDQPTPVRSKLCF